MSGNFLCDLGHIIVQVVAVFFRMPLDLLYDTSAFIVLLSLLVLLLMLLLLLQSDAWGFDNEKLAKTIISALGKIARRGPPKGSKR